MLNLNFTSDPDILAFVDWFVGDRNKSARTGKEYARDIARFKRFNNGELNDATHQQIQDWMRTLRDRNQPQSVRRKVAALSCYFTWRVKKDYREGNPVKKVDLPAVHKGLPRTMSESDVEKLLHAHVQHRRHKQFLEARNAAMFELMYGGGLRRFEVTALDIHDIDFEELTINVRHGKGNKERYTFLSEPTALKLREYLPIREQYARPGETALFLTIDRKRISPRQLWAEFDRARKAAGLPNIVPHTMRHAYATHLHGNGCDIVTIQETLGHTSISTTQRYVHVSLKKKREEYLRCHPRAKAS